jgi:exosortase
MNIREHMNRRNILFLLFVVLAFLMAYTPIKALYDSTSQREYYSHIVLIPLVSIYLFYQKRKAIFSGQEYSLRAGTSLSLMGVLLYLGGRFWGIKLNQNDFTSIIALSAVVFINGAFILSYGVQAFKVALFPLLFLVFVIPIPSALMGAFISFLQMGSTEFTNLLFRATGVPFLREGFIFHLPGMSIEVAKECSGIRSSLALLITAILAGHMFLTTVWKKVLLAILIVPVTMFKNGIRILILTLLGTYVDPRWLTGSSLHRDGGIVFFVLALLLMAPILFYLMKSEFQGTRGVDKLKGARNTKDNYEL